MIHYISPFSPQKNIGGCINDAIAQLNADPSDWVVHTDQDALWLLPTSKLQLEHTLNNTNYHVLGAVTNRLAQRQQLIPGMFNEDSIRAHIDKATELQTADYATVAQTTQVLAAFCLCFRVETWLKLGKFKENSLQFDSQFSVYAKRKGLKLGIMTGLYLLHLYRYTSNNPVNDIRHLLQPDR